MPAANRRHRAPRAHSRPPTTMPPPRPARCTATPAPTRRRPTHAARRRRRTGPAATPPPTRTQAHADPHARPHNRVQNRRPEPTPPCASEYVSSTRLLRPQTSARPHTHARAHAGPRPSTDHDASAHARWPAASPPTRRRPAVSRPRPRGPRTRSNARPDAHAATHAPLPVEPSHRAPGPHAGHPLRPRTVRRRPTRAPATKAPVASAGWIGGTGGPPGPAGGTVSVTRVTLSPAWVAGSGSGRRSSWHSRCWARPLQRRLGCPTVPTASVDMRAPTSRGARAAVAGCVRRHRHPVPARGSAVSGAAITITRSDGLRANYFHVNTDDLRGREPRTQRRRHGGSRPQCELGSTVSAGQIIGFMGDSGNAVGVPHLHFELRTPDGVPFDPVPCAAIGRGQRAVRSGVRAVGERGRRS